MNNPQAYQQDRGSDQNKIRRTKLRFPLLHLLDNMFSNSNKGTIVYNDDTRTTNPNRDSDDSKSSLAGHLALSKQLFKTYEKSKAAIWGEVTLLKHEIDKFKTDPKADTTKVLQDSLLNDSSFLAYLNLEKYGASLDSKKVENWYLTVNKDNERYEKDFNNDFRCSFRNFFYLWHEGGKHIGPPYQKNKKSEKSKLYTECYDEWMVDLLYNTHVGCGTDPEQLTDTLLNKKADILDRALFPTHAVEYNLNQPAQKLYFSVQERNVSKKSKIGIGFGADIFPEVSLGFNLVKDVKHMKGKLKVIGVNDEFYRCARTSSHLKHETLHKHLDIDFRKSITNLRDEMNNCNLLLTHSESKDTNSQPTVTVNGASTTDGETSNLQLNQSSTNTDNPNGTRGTDRETSNLQLSQSPNNGNGARATDGETSNPKLSQSSNNGNGASITDPQLSPSSNNSNGAGATDGDNSGYTASPASVGVDRSDPTKKLTHMINDFMKKYGTHVILECSHGYRKLQTEERTITKVGQFKDFKVDLDTKFMSVAGFEAKNENETRIEESSRLHLDGTYNVGSPKALEIALNGNYQQEDWREKISEEGDVDVISHDNTMSIADILMHADMSNSNKDLSKDGGKEHEKKENWELLSKLYRFWTNVHIQDLQQGWNESIFACSYKITFKRGCCFKPVCCSSHCCCCCCCVCSCCCDYGKGIHVDVESEGDSNSCFSHLWKGKRSSREEHKHVTSVTSANVKSIRISSIGCDTRLNDIGYKMDIFLRIIPSSDDINNDNCFAEKEGFVYHHQIELYKIKEHMVELCFSRGKITGAKPLETETVPPEPSTNKPTNEVHTNVLEEYLAKISPSRDNIITIANARSVALGF